MFKTIYNSGYRTVKTAPEQSALAYRQKINIFIYPILSMLLTAI